MQDEVNSRIIALSIRAGKDTARVTAQVLKEAMREFLKEQAKVKQSHQSKTYHGKQSVGKLMKQNQGLTNIEITDGNIKSFERVANKYNIDFALKKDKATQPPHYLVFFKARDVDVRTAAFKEYSGKELKKLEKPSLRKALAKAQEKAKHMEQTRVKVKERSAER